MSSKDLQVSDSHVDSKILPNDSPVLVSVENVIPQKRLLSAETNENIVATFVDATSMMFAYRLGLDQAGVTAAITYAMFDALIVIWARKRITAGIRRLFKAFHG